MDSGRKESIAVFLGAQKIEQIKAWSFWFGSGGLSADNYRGNVYGRQPS